MSAIETQSLIDAFNTAEGNQVLSSRINNNQNTRNKNQPLKQLPMTQILTQSVNSSMLSGRNTPLIQVEEVTYPKVLNEELNTQTL